MNLHGDIMNIQVLMQAVEKAVDDAMNHSTDQEHNLAYAYKIGHRDARHAAAELSLSAATHAQDSDGVWVSVKDRLPGSDGPYLVFAPSQDEDKPYRDVAWFDPRRPGWQMIPEVWSEAVTYWKELNAPPQPEKGSPK